MLGTLVLQAFPEEPLSAHKGPVRYSTAALIVFGAAIAVAPGQAGETVVGVANPYSITGPEAE